MHAHNSMIGRSGYYSRLTDDLETAVSGHSGLSCKAATVNEKNHLSRFKFSFGMKDITNTRAARSSSPEVEDKVQGQCRRLLRWRKDDENGSPGATLGISERPKHQRTGSSSGVNRGEKVKKIVPSQSPRRCHPLQGQHANRPSNKPGKLLTIDEHEAFGQSHAEF